MISRYICVWVVCYFYSTLKLVREVLRQKKMLKTFRPMSALNFTSAVPNSIIVILETQCEKDGSQLWQLLTIMLLYRVAQRLHTFPEPIWNNLPNSTVIFSLISMYYRKLPRGSKFSCNQTNGLSHTPLCSYYKFQSCRRFVCETVVKRTGNCRIMREKIWRHNGVKNELAPKKYYACLVWRFTRRCRWIKALFGICCSFYPTNSFILLCYKCFTLVWNINLSSPGRLDCFVIPGHVLSRI